MISPKKITIFGAGASGTHLAWQFAKANYQVTLIDNDLYKVEVILKNNYLSFESSKEAHSSAQLAFNPPHQIFHIDKINKDNLPKQDLIILTTKSFDLDRKLGELIQDISAPDTPVVELSNGIKPVALVGTRIETDKISTLRVISEFEEAVGNRLYSGVINYPTTLLKPGEVSLGATLENVGKNGIRIGNTGKSPAALAAIQSIFTHAGIGCAIDQSTAKTIFGKLPSILSVGPQTILNASYMEAATPGTLTNVISDAALREYHTLMQALGLPISKDVEAFIGDEMQVMKNKGDFKGSMMADVNAGNLTETPQIFGALSKISDQLRIATPVLDSIYNLLLWVEAQGLRNKNKLPALRDDITKRITTASHGIPSLQGFLANSVMTNLKLYGASRGRALK